METKQEIGKGSASLLVSKLKARLSALNELILHSLRHRLRNNDTAKMNDSHSFKCVPTITELDLFKFHRKHFANASLEHFGNNFLGPEDDEEEDDGLGYYPDGVKRTLTDEQIAMFRYSEIETIRRERRHAEEAKDHHSVVEGQIDANNNDTEDEEINKDFESPSVKSESRVVPPKDEYLSKTKKTKRKNKGSFKPNVKPDLRKRTWDKVEQGLGSLDYGEDEMNLAARGEVGSQRRRISYEDV